MESISAPAPGASEAPKHVTVGVQTLGLLRELTDSEAGAAFEVNHRQRRVALLHALAVGQPAIDRVNAEIRFGGTDATIVREGYMILHAHVAPTLSLAFYLERPARPEAAPGIVASVVRGLAKQIGEDLPTASPEKASSFVERRRALLDLLEREEWNLSKVARRLKVSRVTVYRLLRNHELERPGGRKPCFGRQP